MVKGIEITPAAKDYSLPNRWAAIPPRNQWPDALIKYIRTFPESIRERIWIARRGSGDLELIDRLTLKRAYIKMATIENADLSYTPEDERFWHSKPCIDHSYNTLVIAGEEVDLPEGFEINE